MASKIRKMSVLRHVSITSSGIVFFLEILVILSVFRVNSLYSKTKSQDPQFRHGCSGILRTKSQYVPIVGRMRDQDNKYKKANQGYYLCPAMIPLGKQVEDSLGGANGGKDLNFEVVKNQIFNELREGEDLLKGFATKIIEHLMQYLKHKIANSFLQFYIVNPLGMELGNLLNNDLNDLYVTGKAGIPHNSTPKTFDMDYLAVDVPSGFSSRISKSCWLIKSKDEHATSAFILLHGWFGNLQSCLPFADAINKLGILDRYHILIVDLKDYVGRSLESNIGLKGVTDIYDAVSYLKKEYGVVKFDIYAQSISGLSALMFNDLCEKAKLCCPKSSSMMESCRCPVVAGMSLSLLKDITIENIIIESPVASVQQHLINTSSESLNWLAGQFITTVGSELGRHIGKLSLQEFLKDPKVRKKVHMLQGLRDTITKPEMLHKELTRNDADLGSLNLHIFKEAGHADLSAVSPGDYHDTIKSVVKGRGIWQILFRGPRTKTSDVNDLIP